MNNRRRFISILLVLLFVIAPIFADVDWTKGKVLGNVPHNEVGYPYISNITKGEVVKKVLPYPANLEIAVEHEADAFHPLTYTLFLYGNPHNYTPVTLTSSSLEISLRGLTGNVISFPVTKGIKNNSIRLTGYEALLFSEVFLNHSPVTVSVKDGSNVYSFVIDTNTFNGKVAGILRDCMVAEDDISTLFNRVADVSVFTAKVIDYVVDHNGVSMSQFKAYIKSVQKNFPNQALDILGVLESFSFYEWVEFVADENQSVDEVRLRNVLDTVKFLDPDYVPPVTAPAAV